MDPRAKIDACWDHMSSFYLCSLVQILGELSIFSHFMESVMAVRKVCLKVNRAYTRDFHIIIIVVGNNLSHQIND